MGARLEAARSRAERDAALNFEFGDGPRRRAASAGALQAAGAAHREQAAAARGAAARAALSLADARVAAAKVLSFPISVFRDRMCILDQ